MAVSGYSIPSFLIVFIFIGLTSAAEAESESEREEFVVTLDHSNFTDFIAKHKFIVVEFYSPGCAHCKNFAPEYEKAASILSTNEPPIVLAKFDATSGQNKAIANEYELRGFPALKILRYGGSFVQEYKGPKETEGIVTYVIKQSGPASVEIKSSEDATSVIDSYRILVVGIFPEFSGEKFENFTTVAERLRGDYEFGHTLNSKLLPHGDSSATGPLVRLLKPFDELFVDFKKFEVDALVTFIEENSNPTVTLFDSDPKYHPYVAKFFYSLHTKAMLFVNFSTDEFDVFRSKYHEVAEVYKGKGISFLMADTNATQSLLQYFGLKEDHPPLMFIQTGDEQKYLKPNVKPDQIAPWIKDFKEGNVLPYLKSEPIPEVNNEPVKTVVGDSLQEMVFNSGKNVLLEFYAPWCPHCVSLAPTLDEVAVAFEHDTDVLVAKFDASANDVPKKLFDVKGYPTLYFRSTTGTLLVYDGNRNKEDIIDFINKNRVKATNHESRKDEL